jgi:hypothetical protein
MISISNIAISLPKKNSKTFENQLQKNYVNYQIIVLSCIWILFSKMSILFKNLEF